MVCLGRGRPYHFKFFKGCLPQILLGPFSNILTEMTFWDDKFSSIYVCQEAIWKGNHLNNLTVSEILINLTVIFYVIS